MESTPHAHDAGHGHITLPILIATLAALLILTWATFAATWVNFGGAINLLIAMVIATIKATLVGLYFMHLRYEKPIVHVILVGTFFFIALFIGAALFDTAHYEPAVEEFRLNLPPGMVVDANEMPKELERRWAPKYFQIEEAREKDRAEKAQGEKAEGSKSDEHGTEHQP